MTSPTLAALQAKHPKWCFICGKSNLHPDGVHSCYKDPVIALLKNAITGLEAQHEADAAEREAADKALIHYRGRTVIGDPESKENYSAYDEARAREEARRKEKETR